MVDQLNWRPGSQVWFRSAQGRRGAGGLAGDGGGHFIRQRINTYYSLPFLYKSLDVTPPPLLFEKCSAVPGLVDQSWIKITFVELARTSTKSEC